MMWHGATCKGSYVLGTACGNCEKCLRDANKLIPQYRAEIADLLKSQARLTAADALLAAIVELRNGEPIYLTPEQLRLWRAYAEMKEK